jgi:hypothetical protein
MEARSQSAAHPNEMNFIFNLNAFSWRQCSQPLAASMRSFGMISTLPLQIKLAIASGG